MKSSDYWKDRFERIEQSMNNQGTNTYYQLEKAFYQAEKALQMDIDKWVLRVAKNNKVTMNEARKMLNAKELAEFKWDVQDYIKYGQENALNGQWMKQLENASAKFHISRLEALKIQTQNTMERVFGNELDMIDNLARKVYTDDYYHTAFELQKGFNIGFDVGQIDERKLDKLISKPWAADGKNFSDRIWDRKTSMINSLHNKLVKNCLMGKSPDDVIKHMTQFVNGNVKNAKNAAGRLVMTEQAFFASAAQKDCFDDLGVEEFEIVATLDNNTSEICQEMDGKHFSMKEFATGITAPPFHPWCRSCTCPYFNDEFSLGERAARDITTGKTYYVPSNIKYPEWKAAFVDGGSKGNFTPAAVLKDFTNKPEEKKEANVKTYENYNDAKNGLTSDVGFDLVESSFNKIDHDLAIDNANQLMNLENKFGVIHKSNGTICSVGSGDAEAYVSSKLTNPMNQNLSLCPRYYKNKAEHIQKLIEEKNNNWSMPFLDENAQIYNVTHEYGHMIQNMLCQERMIENGWNMEDAGAFIDFNKKTKKAMFKWYYNIQKEIDDECFKEIIDIAKENNAEFSLADNISKYGRTNKSEFFAEVFANSQLGKPNELGKAMNIWLKKRGLMK